MIDVRTELERLEKEVSECPPEGINTCYELYSPFEASEVLTKIRSVLLPVLGTSEAEWGNLSRWEEALPFMVRERISQ